MRPNNIRGKLIMYLVEKYGEKVAKKNGLCMKEIKDWRLTF